MTFNQWYSKNKRLLIDDVPLFRAEKATIKKAMKEAWDAGRLDAFQEILREEDRERKNLTNKRMLTGFD